MSVPLTQATARLAGLRLTEFLANGIKAVGGTAPVLSAVLIAGLAGDAARMDVDVLKDFTVTPTKIQPPPITDLHHLAGALVIATEDDVLPGHKVASIITHEARMRGIQPGFLMAVAWMESRFRTRAKGHHTSASGLFQFTSTGWLSALYAHSVELGLPGLRRYIHKDARTGALSVTHHHRRRLLSLRGNPVIATRVAAAVLGQVKEDIASEGALADDDVHAMVYLTHLLGRTGARHLLHAMRTSPTEPVSHVLPASVIANNPGLFRAGENSERTVIEVYDNLRLLLGERASRYARYLESQDSSNPSVSPRAG